MPVVTGLLFAGIVRPAPSPAIHSANNKTMSRRIGMSRLFPRNTGQSITITTDTLDRQLTACTVPSSSIFIRPACRRSQLELCSRAVAMDLQQSDPRKLAGRSCTEFIDQRTGLVVGSTSLLPRHTTCSDAVHNICTLHACPISFPPTLQCLNESACIDPGMYPLVST